MILNMCGGGGGSVEIVKLCDKKRLYLANGKDAIAYNSYSTETGAVTLNLNIADYKGIVVRITDNTNTSYNSYEYDITDFTARVIATISALNNAPQISITADKFLTIKATSGGTSEERYATCIIGIK